MNGEGNGLVGHDPDRLVEMVGDLRDLHVAETLRLWVEGMMEGLEAFFKEAVILVQKSTAGRSMALMQVSKALAQVYQAYLDAIAAQVQYLSVVSPAPALFRGFARPGDSPQPGDVRSVFSQVQVYVDGCWWELGERCKP